MNRNPTIKPVVFLLLILYTILPLFSETAADIDLKNPQIKKGILDLRTRGLHEVFHLDGEWEFLAQDKNETVFLEVPGSWQSVTGTPYTEGIYRLKVLLPSSASGRLCGISFPELSQSMEVFINGRPIKKSGDMEKGITDYTRSQIPIMMEPELEILIKLRNNEFRKGGLIYAPLFGPKREIQSQRETKIWIEAFYIGLLFIISIYHFFLYIQKYQNRSALYLSLAALFMIMRAIVTGENSITFLISNFSWTIDYKIEYISVYMNGIFLVLFCNSAFPFNYKAIKTAIKTMTAAGIMLSLMTVILPVKFLSPTIVVLQLTVILFLILGMIIMIHALCSRQKDSILLFIGLLTYALLAIGDVLYYSGWSVGLFNVSQFGMIVFILTQSLFLARHYGDAFIRAEKLTLSLEDEVDKQTAELRTANESLKEEIEQRVKAEDLLQTLSTTDPLTGAANRLKMNEHLDQCYQVYLRYGNSIGLIMFDLDHFKEINDSFGHQTGDEVLKLVVTTTQNNLRDCDLLARWGGEEFIVLLPLMELQGTAVVAEKIRAAIENCDFPEVPKVTSSFSAVVPEGKSEKIEEIFSRLDNKLYKAKHLGRNVVVS